MSLCLRGNAIISQWIHPSVPPRCPGAPQATANPGTRQPPQDETWPRAPSPLPGASAEPLASTRLTGRRFSLKSNPGERTQAWANRRMDGRTDSGVDAQGAGETLTSRPGWGEREDVQREKCAWIGGWKCVIFLREAGEGDLQTLPNFTQPRAFDQKAPNLLWNGAAGQRKSATLHSPIYQLLFYGAHKPHTRTHPQVTAGEELVQQ